MTPHQPAPNWLLEAGKEMTKRKKRPSRKEKTAYHEAGHAVMCYLLKKKFSYVTIKESDLDEDTGGRLHRPLSEHFFEEAEYGRNLNTGPNIPKMLVLSLIGYL